MKIISFIVSLLIFSMICSVRSSYRDGELDVGETYVDDLILEAQAYAVYQFPYGLRFHALVPDPTYNERIFMLLSHQRCPDGRNCTQNSSQLIVELGLQDLEIESKTILNGSLYGTLVQQRNFPLASNGSYLLTRRGNLLRYDWKNQQVLRELPLPGVIRGSAADNTPTVYLLDPTYRSQEWRTSGLVYRVDLNSLAPSSNFSIDQFDVTPDTPIIATAGDVLYMTGSHNGTWYLWQIDGTTGAVMSQLALPYASALDFVPILILDDDNRLYIGSSKINGTMLPPNEDRAFILGRIQLNGTASIHNTTIAMTAFKMAAYSSYFYDTDNNFLYLVSYEGELVRILTQPNTLAYGGTMLIQSSKFDGTCTINKDSLPFIDSAILYDPNTAYLTAHELGLVIQVNLGNFTMGTVCGSDSDTNPTKFPIWAIAVVIMGFILILSLILLLVWVIMKTNRTSNIPLPWSNNSSRRNSIDSGSSYRSYLSGKSILSNSTQSVQSTTSTASPKSPKGKLFIISEQSQLLSDT